MILFECSPICPAETEIVTQIFHQAQFLKAFALKKNKAVSFDERFYTAFIWVIFVFCTHFHSEEHQSLKLVVSASHSKI